MNSPLSRLLIVHCAMAACALLLSGCVSFSGLDAQSNYADIGNSSIIVLGVSPRYRIHIFDGERKGDTWLRNPLIVTLNTFPEDGYIVAKLSPRAGDKLYGVSGILPDGIALGSRLYGPCMGQRAMTFNAPAGQVVFIGDLDLGPKGGTSIEVKPGAGNFEAARTHLKKHFPAIADRLVNQGSDFLVTDFGHKVQNLNCKK